MSRKAGILLPIFSLPSEYGIGTLGRAAYRWVDFLNDAHQKVWQVLPVGPTSYGDSPYLVNMAHIQKLNYDKVILTNGTELPVSQKMYASIKAKYLRWRNRQ